MVDNNRRRLLKASGTVVGLSAIPSIAAASDDSREEDDELTLNDKTIIYEDEEKTVIGIDLSKSDGEDRHGNSTNRKYSIATVKKESGSVSIREVSSQEYDSLTSDDELTVLSTGTTSSVADDDIIVRSDVYSHEKGECDAIENYTHLWSAVTAEFTDNAGDLGWGTISAALISLVGSSSLSAGASAILVGAITAVGGVAAIVTDVYELTFAASEWDQSIVYDDLAMFSAKIAPGYHRSEGELTTISVSTGHNR